MKSISLIMIAILISACTTTGTGAVSDASIYSVIVGEWDYESGPESCREYGFIGFKRSGKYTRSSENCHIADDSFGYYYYGWYVANGYICFVQTEEHLEHAREFGFVKDHCTWKIEQLSRKEVIIHDIWWGITEEDNEHQVIRLFKPENP